MLINASLNMNTTRTILGIDVVKDKFDVCLLTPAGPRPRTFANHPRGHAALQFAVVSPLIGLAHHLGGRKKATVASA